MWREAYTELKKYHTTLHEIDAVALHDACVKASDVLIASGDDLAYTVGEELRGNAAALLFAKGEKRGAVMQRCYGRFDASYKFVRALARQEG